MSVSFINTPEFDSQWEALGFDDKAQMELQVSIADDPFAGSVVKGTDGVRKVRFARKGEGKSGGVRVAYAVFPGVGIVLLALVFAKNAKANLSDADKEYCKAQVGRIKNPLWRMTVAKTKAETKARPKTTKAGRDLGDGLKEVADALEAGGMAEVEKRFTVRRVELPPSTATAADVAKARALLGASQGAFAKLLGVSANTVRAWEQGVNPLSGMAQRLIEGIIRDPGTGGRSSIRSRSTRTR